MQDRPIDPSDPLGDLIDDPSVTDAQLGAIARQYRGMSRPPQVIVQKASWIEKALLVFLVLFIFGFFADFFYDEHQRSISRAKIDRNSMIACQEWLVEHPDLPLPKECGEVGFVG